MSPSAEEAAQALRAIDAIKARAAGFQDYQAESNQLILWGSAHIIGFVLTALLPDFILLIWFTVIALALALGVFMAVHADTGIPGIGWRYLALIGAIIVFYVGMTILMQPITAEQSALISPMFVSTLYVLRGVQFRSRYILIGVLVVILCLAGYLLLLPYFWWWMAFSYGGTFLVFGLWLRRH